MRAPQKAKNRARFAPFSFSTRIAARQPATSLKKLPDW
jgi:hypothetical protein